MKDKPACPTTIGTTYILIFSMLFVKLQMRDDLAEKSCIRKNLDYYLANVNYWSRFWMDGWMYTKRKTSTKWHEWGSKNGRRNQQKRNHTSIGSQTWEIRSEDSFHPLINLIRLRLACILAPLLGQVLAMAHQPSSDPAPELT